MSTQDKMGTPDGCTPQACGPRLLSAVPEEVEALLAEIAKEEEALLESKE